MCSDVSVGSPVRRNAHHKENVPMRRRWRRKVPHFSSSFIGEGIEPLDRI